MNNVFAQVSYYRTSLMGLAMLWIIFAHSPITIALPLLIKFPFCNLGYGGVDLFLFLSGFGIYCSLTKDNDIGNFFKKRIVRFLPIIPILILYFILAKITVFHTIIGYLTLENFWLDKRNFGFLSYAFLCYTLSPIFVDILNKHLNNIKKQVFFVCFILLLTIPFWGDGRIQGVARLPIYVLGLYAGYYYSNKKVLQKKFLIISQIIAVLGFLLLIITYTILYEYRFQYAIMYYFMFLMILGLTFSLVKIFQKINNKYLISALNFIGKRTLEIFLVDSIITIFYKDLLPFYGHVFLSLSIGSFYAYIISKTKSLIQIYQQRKLFNGRQN